MSRGLSLSLLQGQMSSVSSLRSKVIPSSSRNTSPEAKQTASGRGNVKPQGLPLMATPHLSPASRLTARARNGPLPRLLGHTSYGSPRPWERGNLHLSTSLLKKDVGALKPLSSIYRDKSVLLHQLHTHSCPSVPPTPGLTWFW